MSENPIAKCDQCGRPIYYGNRQEMAREDTEKISDIVAEMRKRCTPYAKSDSTDCRYVAYLGYKEFADRIEAAWRRECESVGNAAAFREAVIKCINLITGFGNAEVVKTPLEVIVDLESILKAALAAPAPTTEKSSAVGNAAAMREALVEIGETYREHPYDHDDDAIANIVDAALAAPARNCDVYKTADETWDAYREWECGLDYAHGATGMDFRAWAFSQFAPTEKGGAE